MSNRIHLEDLPGINPKVLLDLPIDQLELLVSEAKANVAAADAVLDNLKSILETRFERKAADARRAKGKDTGIARIIEGDYEVVADLPKKILWDQKTIGPALDALQAIDNDVDMAKLVKVEIKINERAYEQLAPEHQAILQPARTVNTGKPTYSLKPLAEV
jgi:multidrug resistance efflux pump